MKTENTLSCVNANWLDAPKSEKMSVNHTLQRWLAASTLVTVLGLIRIASLSFLCSLDCFVLRDGLPLSFWRCREVPVL